MSSFVASQVLSLEELKFARRLSEVLGAALSYPRGGPSKVLDHLYLGCESDAVNLSELRELGINHIINCASGYIDSGQGFYGDDFQYLEFDAEDFEEYDIMQHFEETFEFIEKARKSGGKVLIHCIMGVNRSGALATAYVMCYENIGPISAARKVLGVRKCILTNDDFQHQLIKLASKKNLLELDKNEIAM